MWKWILALAPWALVLAAGAKSRQKLERRRRNRRERLEVCRAVGIRHPLYIVDYISMVDELTSATYRRLSEGRTKVPSNVLRLCADCAEDLKGKPFTGAREQMLFDVCYINGDLRRLDVIACECCGDLPLVGHHSEGEAHIH